MPKNALSTILNSLVYVIVVIGLLCFLIGTTLVLLNANQATKDEFLQLMYNLQQYD
jgi:hypothetical protein